MINLVVFILVFLVFILCCTVTFLNVRLNQVEKDQDKKLDESAFFREMDNYMNNLEIKHKMDIFLLKKKASEDERIYSRLVYDGICYYQITEGFTDNGFNIQKIKELDEDTFNILSTGLRVMDET